MYAFGSTGDFALNSLVTAIVLAFFAGFAWVASRLYREHRMELYSLGTRRRAIVYIALGVGTLALSAVDRFTASGFGTVDLAGVCSVAACTRCTRCTGAPEQGGLRSRGGLALTTPTCTRCSWLPTTACEVEPVEVHDLVPGGDEVAHELLAGAIVRVDLGDARAVRRWRRTRGQRGCAVHDSPFAPVPLYSADPWLLAVQLVPRSSRLTKKSFVNRPAWR